MKTFLDYVKAIRVHTWMKRFGHPTPKPTVLMCNFSGVIANRLQLKWSKKFQLKVDQEARRANSATAWLVKIFRKKSEVFRFGQRVWAVRKEALKKMVFVVKNWNEWGELSITGGKDLRASAAYTRGFARAALATFRDAQRLGYPNVVNIDYVNMWSMLDLSSIPAIGRNVRDLEEEPQTKFQEIFSWISYSIPKFLRTLPIPYILPVINFPDRTRKSCEISRFRCPTFLQQSTCCDSQLAVPANWKRKELIRVNNGSAPVLRASTT